MAVSEKQERICRMSIDEVQNSALDVDFKETLIDGLESAKEACNGYTTEQKIQANSENNFTIMRILSKLSLKVFGEEKKRTWKDVLISCKRELMWLGFGVCAMLCFRPELAELFERAMGK